jgi:hypothetical protein
MRVLIQGVCLIAAATMCASCRTVHNVRRASSDKLDSEGTIVFVRPKQYSPLIGTRSLRDYIEVTHESANRNTAGLLEVCVRIRDIGGSHFWDTRGRDFPLSIRTVFYKGTRVGGQEEAPVYETNWETVRMLRGSTREYRSICPNPAGAGYQVIISEELR